MSGFKEDDYCIVSSKQAARLDKSKPDWRSSMGYEGCYTRMRARIHSLMRYTDKYNLDADHLRHIIGKFCDEALSDKVSIEEDEANIRDIIE